MAPLEEPFDIARFKPDGPIWLVVRESMEASAFTTGRGLVSDLGARGTRFIPLFTSLERAETYAGETTATGPALVPIKLDTPITLTALLDLLGHVGHTHVGFDPDTSVRIARIADLQKSIGKF